MDQAKKQKATGDNGYFLTEISKPSNDHQNNRNNKKNRGNNKQRNGRQQRRNNKGAKKQNNYKVINCYT